MHRKILYLFLFAFLFALCGCTAKLTTVRPAEISELRVERMADGVTVTLPSAEHGADLKDTLIFQLEQPYGAASDCAETDGHVYKVSLYIGEKLDTEVVINEDSSVCRGGKRYVPLDKADSPVNIDDWNALFAKNDSSKETDSSAKPAEPSAPPEKDAQPPSEPAEEPDAAAGAMDIVACQGEPKDLPQGAEILLSMPVADALPWSYYISDVRYDGQDFVMVWRDTPKGDAQWLCSIPQTTGDTALRHSIEYTEGSFEGSGEKFLYFTIQDASTFHRSLWCFDLETEYFNRVLETPCSNMIRLKDEPGDARNLGWIVYDHYLAAVDLAQGTTYEGMTIDLSEYIPYAESNLFYELGAFGTHKFVRLSDIGNYAVEIEVITAEPETSAPELREAYQMDILTRNFWAMQ